MHPRCEVGAGGFFALSPVLRPEVSSRLGSPACAGGFFVHLRLEWRPEVSSRTGVVESAGGFFALIPDGDNGLSPTHAKLYGFCA